VSTMLLLLLLRRGRAPSPCRLTSFTSFTPITSALSQHSSSCRSLARSGGWQPPVRESWQRGSIREISGGHRFRGGLSGARCGDLASCLHGTTGELHWRAQLADDRHGPGGTSGGRGATGQGGRISSPRGRAGRRRLLGRESGSRMYHPHGRSSPVVFRRRRRWRGGRARRPEADDTDCGLPR
jgi:hypothetical protein